MAPPAWLLAPLILGASRVAVGLCGPRCPTDGPAKAEANLRSAQRLLSELKRPPDAVESFTRAPPDPGPALVATGSLNAPFAHDGAPRVYEALGATDGRTPEIDDPNLRVGAVQVTDACTVCGSCAGACPTDALQYASKDGRVELSFGATACVACARCTSVCPETAAGAIRLRAGLSRSTLASSRVALRSTDTVRCKHCGGPVAPQAMVERVLSLLGAGGSNVDAWACLCMECRGQVSAPPATAASLSPSNHPNPR